jgi:hypothetical protein
MQRSARSFHLEAWRGGPRRYRRLQFSCDARVHVQPAGRCVPGWCRSPCRPARAGQRTLSDPSRPARRRRDRLSRSAVDVHGPRGPRFELDHQTTRRFRESVRCRNFWTILRTPKEDADRLVSREIAVSAKSADNSKPRFRQNVACWSNVRRQSVVPI